MNSWKECKLGDVAEINMGQSPKSEFYNQDKIGLPFLQGNRTFGLKYPYFDTYCSEPTKIAKHGEILFSVRAPVGDINIANDEICIGRGLCSINSKNKNNEFLYYLLHFLKNEIINNESGSVFGSINRTDLSNINILYPPLEEQKAIAEVLSSIDDKIELLHRQNQTLESLAQTLFRQWFIEEAKDEWEEVTLSDVMELKYGKDHKHLNDGKIPIYGSGGIMRYGNTAIYENESILIPRKGTLSNIFYVDEPFWTVDTIFWSKINSEKISGKLLFEFLKTLNFSNMNVGSAVPSLTTKVLNEISFALPSLEEQEEFKQYTDNAWDKVKQNKKQIQTLENLRDTLLPKLLSGEVRVKLDN